MNEEQRNALSSVQFGWAVTPDDIWSPMHHHVDGLHPHAVDGITRAVAAAGRRPQVSPMGIVLRGERGVGKTHMLGWLRQQVQRQGGSFFLLKLLDRHSFWEGAVHGVVGGLLDRQGGQLGRLLGELARLTGQDQETSMRLTGTLPVRRQDIEALLDGLRPLDAQVAVECQDTLRALVLYRAKGKAWEAGNAYLVLPEGVEATDRAEWGFRTTSRSPQLLLGDLSKIFALVGPVVMAVDQVDSVITQAAGSPGEEALVDRLADGLMRVREETRRTIVVVACLPRSWDLIEHHAVNSAADRFRVLDLRTAMPSAAVSGAIVERHLAGLYGEIGFTPPHATWPVHPSAFAGRDVAHWTPRRLLQRVDEHIRWCLTHDTVEELRDFAAATAEPAGPPAVVPREADELDALFARLRDTADILAPLDHQREDERMQALLGAVLHCFVLERGADGPPLTVDASRGGNPPLHARLRLTIDEAGEGEVHWSFRAIAHTHPRAVLARLKSAQSEAELRRDDDKRHLVVLRNTAFSGGPATTAALEAFRADGGLDLPVAESDLRLFTALEKMRDQSPPGFLPWLLTRRPATSSRLLTRALADLDHFATTSVPQARHDDPGPAPEWPGVSGTLSDVTPDQPATSSEETDAPGEAAEAVGELATDEPSVRLGTGVVTGTPFTVPLALLRKHTVVFAGSGSGKTVLLRRLVEEAALQGVSSILIDTNNDLARLGDPWPSPPALWEPGDAERADRYLRDTDVAVWTPRREAGRPLTLDPLPGFDREPDDPDEFRTAIDAAVAGLVPRTNLGGRKATTGRAVLTQALTHFVRGGGGELRDFLAFLADLPPGISTVRDAPRLAADMADGLNAEMINDPVFGGAGERLDPGVLLTPPAGKRARVSVISCIGLPNDDQRQTFVNQLQLALFSWIKRNPARDRPLGGLFVLDEAQTFVSSRTTTASTQSTLTLASQARKYGLGMVYATQAPKALHNVVSGNAATQFFGLLNAPVQIQAASDLARAKGGRIDDVSRLPAGQFYGATEGTGLSKVQVPMCLSHHPPTALAEEEVLARAQASAVEAADGRGA
ncbi:helicase HerA domain-containing protein [Saccharothrix lopnurensis]|uniref:Helicase HerA domain-containing protein n=1 Tax=Saccharothrix lopnurensis TaxID=1670621 RepID=A0ABW1PE52_9PSEU